MRILGRGGYEARWERTSGLALETAKDWSPDVVLLDRRLPDGDGLALARRLRRQQPRPRVVVMSGDPLDAAEQRLVDAHLLKPATVRAVLDAVAG
ncbi:MAG: response regulator [Acidimicrobiia bacterium]|nr:response regulator [Acidimicrobiia bacterium]